MKITHVGTVLLQPFPWVPVKCAPPTGWSGGARRRGSRASGRSSSVSSSDLRVPATTTAGGTAIRSAQRAARERGHDGSTARQLPRADHDRRNPVQPSRLPHPDRAAGLRNHLARPRFGRRATRGRRIADLADLYYINVAPHHIGSPILSVAVSRQCAAILNFLAAEIHWPPSVEWKALVDAPVVEDGFIAVPDRPGLGVRLDEDAVRRQARDILGFFD